MNTYMRYSHGPIAAAMRFCARAYSAIAHPMRPPLLAMRWSDSRGNLQLCDDPHMILAIAYNLGYPSISFVTLPMSYWHRSEADLPPAAAWSNWRFVPTGEYIRLCKAAGVPIGTYHAHGIGMLITQGYDRRDAERLVREYNASASASA